MQIDLTNKKGPRQFQVLILLEVRNDKKYFEMLFDSFNLLLEV